MKYYIIGRFAHEALNTMALVCKVNALVSALMSGGFDRGPSHAPGSGWAQGAAGPCRCASHEGMDYLSIVTGTVERRQPTSRLGSLKTKRYQL